MKAIFSQLAAFFSMRESRRNTRFLLRLALGVVCLILFYSVLFHYIMRMEGRDYSFITGTYWTLTVMSTLGFGDITFISDLGMLFSMLVLISGIMLFMILLPFIFIRFIYQPWIEAHKKNVVPRQLPENTRGHVLIIGSDDLALTAYSRLRHYQIPSYIVTDDQAEALALFEQSVPVVIGELDSADTYKSARVSSAAMVLALQGNLKNTNIAATVRDIAEVPIAANITNENARDILELAGSDYVFNFTNKLGAEMARRVFAGKMESNTIASFENLHIAEAQASDTRLVGKTLRQLNFRAWLGLNVVGIWQGSEFMAAHPDVVIDEGAVLLLAGTREQLARLDKELQPKRKGSNNVLNPVLIIGGGKVGQSVAANLEGRGIPYRVLDKSPAVVKAGDEHFIQGDAEDILALREAGIDEAHSIVITTHSDDLNIYLTLYCRKLRPEVQIISRCNLSRNIKSLYGAGANLVMAISSMASNAVINLLTPDRVYQLTEGLNIFRVPMPKSLVGKTLRNSNIRQDSMCNVVAMRRAGQMMINQDPDEPFKSGDELVMIGTGDAEKDFFKKYV